MKQSTGGFALIVALSLVVVLAIVLVTYSTLTVGNARTSASSGNSSAGFYAAEAALNARAEQIRQKFKGFSVPTGTGPTTTQPCVGANTGSGDFICQTTTVGGRSVKSYARAQPSYPMSIPAGETFEYLSAMDTPITVYGQTTNAAGNPEAIANLVFHSRLVPLFQFAVFFDKDLEFTNTASLNLSGPVHTNGNLFLDSGDAATLRIQGQTTASVGIYRGWKHADYCGGTVTVADDGGTDRVVPCAWARSQLTPADMRATWGNQMKLLPVLEVPKITDMQPVTGATYWKKADVRVVLKRTSGGSSSSLTAAWAPRFVRADGTQIGGVSCPAVTTSQTFRDNREAQYWEDPAKGNTPERANRRLMDVDVPGLLACLQANRVALGLGASGIAETTEGGLVVYLSVDDVKTGGVLSGVLGGGTVSGSISQGGVANNYGVRLTNGGTLRSSVPTDPAPQGLTFVTDQAMIVQGHYNKAATRAAGWIPSALIADSINVLSENWKSSQTQACQYRASGNTYYMSQTNYGSTLATSWVLYRPNGEWYDASVLGGAALADSTPPSTAMTVSLGGSTPQTWYGYRAGAPGVTPAMADSAPAGDGKSQMPMFCRSVVPTTDAATGITSGSIVRAAVLAGTATTGSENGLYNDGNMAQSGGVHNMMRFHEDWGANGTNPFTGSAVSADYVYSGSLVSLNVPLHAAGDFQRAQARFYQPPRRVWNFDTQFRDAANLPPLTPRFVYLKQDNFTRQFEQP